MFNPPAALLATRMMTGEAARTSAERPQRRALQPARILDDPWLDPLAAAPAVEPPRARRRPASWRVSSTRA